MVRESGICNFPNCLCEIIGFPLACPPHGGATSGGFLRVGSTRLLVGYRTPRRKRRWTTNPSKGLAHMLSNAEVVDYALDQLQRYWL